MAETKPYTGGCQCGALRYEARDEPVFAGLCYCEDCRRTTGSIGSPFMAFRSADLTLTGATAQAYCTALRGTKTTRNFCARCHALVFGGEDGIDEILNIYAGTLDEPSRFIPRVAIMTRGKPDWALIPEGLRVFERMPG
jgi:hypothetical protein